MTIEEEISRLGELEHVGMALVQFSHSLSHGAFKKESAAWIYSPNYVGFEVRFVRVKKLNLLIRWLSMPPEVQKLLPLYVGPLTYGRAEIVSPRQLSAACAYIEASWRDWYRHIFRKDPELTVTK